MRWLTYLWIGSFVGILAGCTTARVEPNKVFSLPLAKGQSTKINLVDLRKDEEKGFQIRDVSYLLGDRNFQPEKMVALEQNLGVLLQDVRLRHPIVVELFKVELIDFTGAVGASNLASNTMGYSGLSKMLLSEDLMASCTISIRYGNDTITKKDFNSYPSSKLEAGVGSTVSSVIKMLAEQIMLLEKSSN